jgi:NADH-quinone oxidoreductase subunit K
MIITTAHYLVLAAVLFSLAVAGIFINRKNVILLLMCGDRPRDSGRAVP